MANPEIDTTDGDVTPPPAPMSIIVTAYGKGLMVSVLLVEGLDFLEYEFWKKVGAGGTYAMFAHGRISSMVDLNTVYGTTYFYKARGVDTSGNVGAFGGEASGTPATMNTPDITPNAVTNLVSHEGFGINATTSSVTTDVPGETITLTVSSAASPIMINWSAQIVLINTAAVVNNISLGLSLVRNGVVIHSGTVNFTVVNGSSVGLPVHFGYIDTGLFGSTVYKIRWSVLSLTAPGGQATMSDTVLKALELKR